MDVDRNSSVLITGGRGFIGRAVAILLRRTGYRVVSLDQSRPMNPRDDHESVREVQCDISHASQLQRVFEAERIDEVIHLAAILPTAAQRAPLRATQVNIEGSLNLLEMARRFSVRRVVFGGSVSIYGTCPADQVVSETDRAAPEDLYGTAKLYVERLGGTYRSDEVLEFVSLRIGRVVGPGARSATSAWRSQIFELLDATCPAKITLPYLGSERVLLIHVEDVAMGLLTLLRAARPAFGVYNAPCESVVVEDLKTAVEGLNSNIQVRLGDGHAAGNPQLLDASRFRREFDFRTTPIAERLRQAAGK